MSQFRAGFVFLAAFGCLVGCGATVQKITGPDGTENQLISCGEIEGCYQKSNEICNGPYKIVNTNSETSGYNGMTGTTVKLLIKCGEEGSLKK